MTGSNFAENNHSGGLLLTTRGAILINSLTASGNTGIGANIANTASLAATPQNVTLTGTNVFNSNSTYGLNLNTFGTIALSNVTANGNQYGAFLDNEAGSTLVRNVTLSGVNNFNLNQYDGLDVSSLGLISINSITANSNGQSSSSGSGAYLSNQIPGSTAGVTLTGTNTFNSNWQNGLFIVSRGAITLNNITANSNGLSTGSRGVQIDNTNSLAPVAPGVTLTGINTFNSNKGTGLYVTSKGAITASNLHASNSVAESGASLDNSGSSSGSAGVTLSGIAVFSNNNGTGLTIRSPGAVALSTSSLTAIGNVNWYGVDIYNNYVPTLLKPVSMSGTSTINGNAWRGLSIVTAGAITLSSVTASNTVGGFGAYLDNSASTTAHPQNITLTGTNVFNGNTGNYGVWVYTYGAIAVNNLTATGNDFGAYLQNNDAVIASPRNVTLTGVNNVSSNLHDGLQVYSRGLISISSLTASNNGLSLGYGTGASLSNNASSATAGVTLTGVNTFSGNYNSGLSILTFGAITVNSITASSNGGAGHTGFGASFNNVAAGAKPVTLTGTNTFNSNYGNYGLVVYSSGLITASNITANGNVNTNGVNLVNTSGVLGVTFTGVDAFNTNGYTGLSIEFARPHFHFHHNPVCDR